VQPYIVSAYFVGVPGSNVTPPQISLG